MFEYMVLAALSEQPDRSMQMSDIADIASSSLSRLSHSASRLEKSGYLTRSQLPGGGRRTIATLTDAGHGKVVAAAPGHVTDVSRLVVDALSADELDGLRVACRGVLAAIDPDFCVDGLSRRTQPDD